MPARAARRFLPGIFVALGLMIAVLSYVTHARARAGYLAEKGAELHAIADLKVSQIVAWRAERVADARVTAADPLLAAAVRDWLDAGARSERAGAIRARLGALHDARGYERVSLLDAQGRVRLTVPGPNRSEWRPTNWRARRSRQPRSPSSTCTAPTPGGGSTWSWSPR